MRNGTTKWIALAATAAIAFALPAAAKAAQRGAATPEKRFIHHVFFYLKRPGNAEDKARLVQALNKLSAAPTIRTFQIGHPADTHRDVIERGYDVSWTLTFDSPADQASYQDDPIHLKFVEENAALWSRVVVYDTVAVTN